MGPPDYSGFRTTYGPWITEIKKNSVVTGIEPTASALLDQRRSRSDNQAPFEGLTINDLRKNVVITSKNGG